MKRIFKSLLFIITLLISIYYYNVITNQYMDPFFTTSYGRGLEYKFNKLSSIDNNKVVFVGGSNVAFGIDSDIIERKLEVPVVNMALHASLSTYVIVEPVLPYLKKGDIMIISREFGGGDKLYGSSPKIANYFRFMPLRARLEVYKNLDAIAPILKNIIISSQENLKTLKFEKQYKYRLGPYSSNAFRNDNLLDKVIDFKMTNEQYNEIKRIDLNPISDSELLDYYRGVNEKLKRKGVSVYFSIPAIIDVRHTRKDMIRYYQKLSEDTGIPLLSTITYDYPRDKMFNTMYHLNKKGREDRSLNSSSEISKAIGSLSVNSDVSRKHVIYKNESEQQREISELNSFKLGDYNKESGIITFSNPEDKSV